jgi:hypothetical protein
MEGYTPEEVIREAEKQKYQSQQEQVAIPETEEEKGPRRSWMDFLFGPIISYDTTSLEAGQTVLQEQLQDRDMSVEDQHFAHMAQYEIGLEFLRRRDPQARNAIDQWTQVYEDRLRRSREWEEHIVVTEGEDGLRRRRERGESYPGFGEYTPEELDLYVNSIAAKVRGGLLPASEIQVAHEIREAGGFMQYEKKKSREHAIDFWQRLNRNNSSIPENEPKNRVVMARIEERVKKEGWFDEFQREIQKEGDNLLENNK